MFAEEEGSAPYIEALKKLKVRAAAPVGRLSLLLQDHLITNYDTADFDHPSTIKFSRRSWFRRQGEIKQLQDEIKGLRDDISKELATASA
jgi:hypothetical protein